MSATFNVSSDVLFWIMAQVPYDALPAKVVQSLQQWAAGVKQPTFNQIEAVSKATSIPLGYFFLQNPPVEDVSLAQYRTVDSLEVKNPSRNLIDTIHDMAQVQEWTREHLVAQNAESLSYVGGLKTEKSPIRLADSIRNLLNLSVEWYKNTKKIDDSFRLIRNAISEAGTLVMMSGVVGNNTHRPLEISEFRAFTIVNEYVPLIFINATDSYSGRLFSLLHEFSHVLIGENSLYNDRHGGGKSTKKTEPICNAAAAEVLVPQSAFLTEWAKATHKASVENAIQFLAKKIFHCGRTVIARRALDSGKIDSRTYQGIVALAIKQYSNRQTQDRNQGGDFYKTVASRIDHRFLKMLDMSVREGNTLYSDAFRLTNTNRTTYAKLLNQAGGVEE